MYQGFVKRYFASEIARQDGHLRGALTNPKQPVKDPSFVEPKGVGARYLPWDLSSKNTSSYGLDARTIAANLEAFRKNTSTTNASIDGLVESLSDSSRAGSSKGYGGALNTVLEYGMGSTTSLPGYGASNTMLPTNYDASPTLVPNRYSTIPTTGSLLGAYGPN